MKKYKVINKIIRLLAWLLLFIGVISISFNFSKLPYTIGVHFDSKGFFDVYVNKNSLIYVAFPYVTSFLIIMFSYGLFYLLNTTKILFKVSKVGEEKIRFIIGLLIGIHELLWVFFLSIIWSNCIIKQSSLNVIYPNFLLMLLCLIVIVLVSWIIKTIVKHE